MNKLEPRWRSRAVWVVPALAAVPVVWIIGNFAQQAVYPAPRVPVPSPAPAPYEEVRLALADGTQVVGWAWDGPAGPAAGSNQPPAAAPVRPAVLFLHGNGENLETMRQVGLLDDLRRLGAPFLALDYPGYGRSGGRPSERGLVEAGGAALGWLRERHPDRPLVACGWSLGAAVAVALAADPAREVAGLVALSPWSSLLDVARHHIPVISGLLLRERYDSVAAAARIRVPALLVHGRDDAIIPFRFGRRLAAALPAESTRFVAVPGAGHNDLLGQPVVWQELERFLAAQPRERPAPGPGATEPAP